MFPVFLEGWTMSLILSAWLYGILFLSENGCADLARK